MGACGLSEGPTWDRLACPAVAGTSEPVARAARAAKAATVPKKAWLEPAKDEQAQANGPRPGETKASGKGDGHGGGSGAKGGKGRKGSKAGMPAASVAPAAAAPACGNLTAWSSDGFGHQLSAALSCEVRAVWPTCQ